MKIEKKKIAIIGMGYVGLPLAVAFQKKYSVIGYDINHMRVLELKKFHDKTLEISKSTIKKSINLKFTSNPEDLSDCNVFIITVPTPIKKNKNPDLKAIKDATKMVASLLKRDDLIIYESTVYPGVTEEICVPIIEKITNFKINRDFYCGYSPERINPGDKKNTIDKIVKVTSGSNDYARKLVDGLYKSVIKAGTFSAVSIKTAEAAKVIENTQRDINIALINELSVIFNKLNLDTSEVLQAAETKWNFLPFKPGLVGGHCIGVDPYYLTYKANQIGVKPNVILSGRKVNDLMARHVAKKLISKMKEKKITISKSKILILGVTFKENCPDIRNTKIFDIIDDLKKYNSKVDLFDTYVNLSDVPKKYKNHFIKKIKPKCYDAVVLAVPHDYIKNYGLLKLKKSLKKNSVIFDVKSIFYKDKSDLRL